MNTQSPLPPNSVSPPPSSPSTSSGQDEKTSFAPPGSTERNVAVPTHTASRIMLRLLFVVILLVALLGVYALVKQFSVEQVYRWLNVKGGAAPTNETATPPEEAESEIPLTAGNSLAEIEADLNATTLSDFDQEASGLQADVDAQE